MAETTPDVGTSVDAIDEEVTPTKGGTYSERRAEFRNTRGVFSLLASHPETRPTPKKIHRKKEDPEWVKVQMKTFMKWANSLLEKAGKPLMTDLQKDMKDGVVLIALLEILTAKEIGVKYHKAPKTRVQMVDNLQVAFKFMEEEKLEHTSMNPNDIVDGNLKLLLGILWRFIFKYQISGNLQKPKSGFSRTNSDGTHGEMSASKMLLAWFQATLPQFQVTNFSQDWNDGIKLSALVNYCKPGLIPNWDQKDPQNASENIANAISLANEHLGIPEVIHAEDLAMENPDRQAVMTYLSYFCCPGSPGEKALMDWIEVVIPEMKITNFSTDWRDGDALCALVSAFSPSSICRDDLEGQTNVEITHAAMQAAKEQFNINCLSSAEEFTSADCDQLPLMVYLTNFRFIQEERKRLPYLSAIGSGITGVEVGSEAQLEIEGDEELDEKIVEIRVHSPDLSEVEVQGVTIRSGTPAFQYRPTIPGTYTVEVKYSGEHVKGSPYKVRHLPTLDSVTDGRGLHRACVGRQAQFTVNVSDLGVGVLNIRILDPDDFPLEVITNEGASEYTVTYTPKRIGDHKIELEWDATPVADEIDVDESITTLECIYTVSVFDASQCVVKGDGLTRAIIGEVASFQIDTSAVGKGSLWATVSGSGTTKLNMTSFEGDTYCYEYTPEDDGELQFDIMWEMVPIAGSPFKVTPIPRTPAMNCIVKEMPTGPVHVLKAFSIAVTTPPDTDCKLEGRLSGPRASKKPCTVSDIDKNTKAISVCPLEVGTYNVDITYGGNPIPASPVPVEVNDPSKCWVVNPEVLAKGSWQCGQQVLVRVDTTKAGKGELAGKVRGPTESVESKTVNDEDGNRLVCFTPTETGQYTVEFLFDGEKIQPRPYKMRVEDDSLEGIAITKPVSQTGYHYANKQLDIRISAPGRDEKLFSVNAKGVNTGAAATCTLVPTGEDTYSMHFTASQPDDYRVTVEYNGKGIPGSPFTLSIGLPPSPDNVEAYDPVLPFRASGDPIELLFNVRDAGTGSLNAHVTDTSSDDWFQHVEIEEESQELHRVSFVPPKNDVYTVTVEWSGQPVRGSPFKIDYREQVTEPSVCVEFQPDEGMPGIVIAAAEGAASGLLKTDVRQFKRGHYQLSFLPPVRELFKLMVFWNKQEIKGSPFIIDLTPSPPKSLPMGVRVVSLPVSVNRESGIFSAFATDSKSSLVRPQLSYSKNKDYINILFPSLMRDSYELFVYWNQNLIAGSPFKIDLRA